MRRLLLLAALSLALLRGCDSTNGMSVRGALSVESDGPLGSFLLYPDACSCDAQDTKVSLPDPQVTPAVQMATGAAVIVFGPTSGTSVSFDDDTCDVFDIDTTCGAGHLYLHCPLADGGLVQAHLDFVQCVDNTGDGS